MESTVTIKIMFKLSDKISTNNLKTSLNFKNKEICNPDFIKLNLMS